MEETLLSPKRVVDQWRWSYLFSQSSGIFPQKPQGSPFSLKLLFWLAHVPENSPSFFAQILIAIPANPSANRKKVIRRSFMNKIVLSCKDRQKKKIKFKQHKIFTACLKSCLNPIFSSQYLYLKEEIKIVFSKNLIKSVLGRNFLLFIFFEVFSQNNKELFFEFAISFFQRVCLNGPV